MPQQVALASRVEVYHMLNEMLGSVPMVRWRVTGLYPVVLNILQVYDVALLRVGYRRTSATTRIVSIVPENLLIGGVI